MDGCLMRWWEPTAGCQTRSPSASEQFKAEVDAIPRGLNSSLTPSGSVLGGDIREFTDFASDCRWSLERSVKRCKNVNVRD